MPNSTFTSKSIARMNSLVSSKATHLRSHSILCYCKGNNIDIIWDSNSKYDCIPLTRRHVLPVFLSVKLNHRLQSSGIPLQKKKKKEKSTCIPLRTDYYAIHSSIIVLLVTLQWTTDFYSNCFRKNICEHFWELYQEFFIHEFV